MYFLNTPPKLPAPLVRDDPPIINPKLFRHLAPAELHSYHRTFDHLYRHWLGRELAWERETGLSFGISPMMMVDAILRGRKINVPVGDPIPAIEMLINQLPDGSEIIKVLPRHLQQKIRQDQAATAESSTVTSPVMLFMELCRMDAGETRMLGTRRIFMCPAHLLIKPRHLPAAGPSPFTIYAHSFGDADREEDPHFIYYGVTQRSWQQRWAEHRRQIDQGSRLKFHATFREAFARGEASFVSHEIIDLVDTLEEMWDLEERVVADRWGDPHLLNMIPGGKAGLEFMRQHGMIGKRSQPLPHQRDTLLENWLRHHKTLPGQPAPWVSDRWSNDPSWASRFVCAGVGRLSEAQVREIRRLGAEGLTEVLIRDAVAARTTNQVRRVLAGETYTRVV